MSNTKSTTTTPANRNELYSETAHAVDVQMSSHEARALQEQMKGCTKFSYWLQNMLAFGEMSFRITWHAGCWLFSIPCVLATCGCLPQVMQFTIHHGRMILLYFYMFILAGMNLLFPFIPVLNIYDADVLLERPPGWQRETSTLQRICDKYLSLLGKFNIPHSVFAIAMVTRA